MANEMRDNRSFFKLIIYHEESEMESTDYYDKFTQIHIKGI